MEICHFGLSKGLTGTFYGCERVEKTFWFVVSSYLKHSAFKAVERDASFKPQVLNALAGCNASSLHRYRFISFIRQERSKDFSYLALIRLLR